MGPPGGGEGAATDSSAELQARDSEIAELKARIAELEAAPQPQAEAEVVVDEAPAAEPEPEPAPVAAAPVAAAPAADATAPALATAGIIELAQRLHDEHIAEGQAQKDKLISEAEQKASQIVAEAEQKSRDELSRLDTERSTLENRISELRQFERDYRTQLRSYIEGHLRDLDASSTATGSAPVPAVGL